MKSKYLFPAWCRLVGYLLAIPGFILGYLYIFRKYEIPGFGLHLRTSEGVFQSSFENFTNELAIFLVICGLLMIAFAKGEKEDELTAKLRLNSLYWSVMIYYIVYFIGLIFSMTISEIPFVGDHMSELNLISPLLIFIVRYNYLLHFDREHYLVSHPKFLPNQPFRSIGILLSIVGISALSYLVYRDRLVTETTDWSAVAYAVLVVGLLLWAFSKNRAEDEMTMQQRLESLQLAIYFNYSLLLIATLFVYSFSFLLVLLFAQFSILVFFVIRMEYNNYKNNQALN